MLKEKCSIHIWKPSLLICSCKQQLCLRCLKEHSHENMRFMSLKDFYESFYQELFELKNFIMQFLPEINKEEIVKNIEQVRGLEQVILFSDQFINNKEKVYLLTPNQIFYFKEKKLLNKIREHISIILTEIVEKKQNKIKKILKEQK